MINQANTYYLIRIIIRLWCEIRCTLNIFQTNNILQFCRKHKEEIQNDDVKSSIDTSFYVAKSIAIKIIEWKALGTYFVIIEPVI